MINYYRKCKNIDRLSSSFKHRGYNLLEHMYMVTVLFKYFASKEDVSYGVYELDLILNHDILESESMDLIYPIKNLNEKTKKSWKIIEDEVTNVNPKLKRYSDKAIKEGLSELQYALFKVCDTLDLLIFVKEEISMGNNTKSMKTVYSNCLKIIDNQKFNFNSVKKFIESYEI